MPGIQGSVSEYKSGSQILQQGRLRLAFDEEIYNLNIEKALLLMLLSKMGKESEGRMKFWWQTKERKSDSVSSTAVGGAWAAGAAAAGTLTVGANDKYLFAEGDVIMLPAISTAINIVVTAVNQGTGVITAQTVAGGNIDLSGVGSSYPTIFLISNAFEIGSGKGTIKSQQPIELYNYIQIIQTPIGITTTAQHLDYRGRDELDEQRFESGVDHAFKLEKNLFFGERYMQTTGLMNSVYPQYFAGGLIDYISTNVTNAAGALTQSEFGAWVKTFTQYAKNPIIFAGDLVYEALTTWSEQKLEVQRTEDTLGMAVTHYLTPYGDRVKVVPHRELLTGSWAGVAFGVDLNDVKMVHLEGLDTHLEVDIQQPDLKQKIDEYRTWQSLKVINEKKHGYLCGVTSISTS